MTRPGCRRPTPTRLRAVSPPLISTLGLLALGACAGDQGDAPSPGAQASAERAAPSIVGVARVAGQFSTLLAAVEAAGLTSTLEEDGPFTVFAPTDGAFANLPEGTVEGLLDDPDALATVLLHHVVPGRLTQAELRGRSELETAGGTTLQVRNTEQGITIEGTYLLTADVGASNGIVHVITSVLVPGSSPM